MYLAEHNEDLDHNDGGRGGRGGGRGRGRRGRGRGGGRRGGLGGGGPGGGGDKLAQLKQILEGARNKLSKLSEGSDEHAASVEEVRQLENDELRLKAVTDGNARGGGGGGRDDGGGGGGGGRGRAVHANPVVIFGKRLIKKPFKIQESVAKGGQAHFPAGFDQDQDVGMSQWNVDQKTNTCSLRDAISVPGPVGAGGATSYAVPWLFQKLIVERVRHARFNAPNEPYLEPNPDSPGNPYGAAVWVLSVTGYRLLIQAFERPASEFARTVHLFKTLLEKTADI